MGFLLVLVVQLKAKTLLLAVCLSWLHKAPNTAALYVINFF